MRKLYKNMIFALLETLRSAASEAKNLFVRNDTDTLINLLADCQDCANQIGELVAEFEGAEHITISYLREYCELLYNVSQAVDKTDYDIDIKKELRKQLSKIRSSVENDIRTTIEVVFFPYKSSMFDSLESIWLAAKDDPDCDAYVVPIPYYDRNPDHSFGQMHYEGHEYPDYVPVVDWRKYNVEERRPDVIFVHNPYDDGNYVTSVHPDYYSKRLREFTDCLCYAPYFVVAGNNLEEHFVTTAGCIYAHKVFVESDGVRESYIKHYKKNFGNKYGRAEDKFFAFGSPKIDKVLNTKKEDCTLPEEWRKLIEKPDGTRKKVIFYNTSLAAMLRESEEYLKKLRHVLSAFKGRDDIVLWWRPHPLMEQTFDSMRPGLAKDYREFVRAYILDGFGIYDNTSDLHRAIAWCDAYYGDISSVVSLFQASKKMVMIENVHLNDSSKEGLLNFRGVGKEDERFGWACDEYTNVLFRLDFETDTAEVVAINPSVPIVGKEQYYCFAFSVLGDEIISFPHYGTECLVYNKKTKDCHTIKLDEKFKGKSNLISGFVFGHGTVFKGVVYRFGGNTNAVLEYNEDGTIDYNTALYDAIGLRTKNGDRTKSPIYMSPVSENGSVILICLECSSVIQYNLVEHTVEKMFTDSFIQDVVSADYASEELWLVLHSPDRLVRVNIESGETRQYTGFPQGLRSSDNNVKNNFRIVNCESCVFLLPIFTNLILKFDKHSEQFSIVNGYSIPNESVTYKFVSPFRHASKVYTNCHCNSAVVEIDTTDGTFKEHKFKLSDSDYKEYYYSKLSALNSNFSESLFGEKGIISLDVFLDINSNSDYKIELESTQESAGQKIYEYTKGFII